jgi:hypothetical protein
MFRQPPSPPQRANVDDEAVRINGLAFDAPGSASARSIGQLSLEPTSRGIESRAE